MRREEYIDVRNRHCAMQDVNKETGSLLKPVLYQSEGKSLFPSSSYIQCKAALFLILLIVQHRAVMNGDDT